MTTTTITALTAGTALSGTEVAPFDQGASTVKITATQIKTWTSASPTLVTPALGTPTSGTLTSCTGLPAAGVVGTAAILGANTFTAMQTIAPANNEAAITFTRATLGVGTIATAGTTVVTGTGTKFLTQVAAGDTITPSGQSVRTVSYVISDTSLVLTSSASGSGSGLSYTLSGGSFTLGANGFFTISPSSPGSGQQSERWGMGATTASNTVALAVGNLASVTNNGGVALGQLATAGTGVAIGQGSNGGGGAAIGFGATASDANGTAIAIGYQASVGSFQSIKLGRNSTGSTANADGQLIIGTDATAAARITDAWIGGGRVSATPTGLVIHGTGGSGSNIVGSDVRLAGGIPTGTGAGGNVGFQTAPTLQSSGSTANSLVDREICVAAGKALTSGAAASLVDIALPTLKMAGGTLRYNIICSDGTDMQSLAGEIVWSAVNKGGSYTVSIKTPNGSTADDTTAAKSVSAGTLTLSWALTSGTNKVTIQPTATTSLTATTFRMYYQIENHSDQAITVL